MNSTTIIINNIIMYNKIKFLNIKKIIRLILWILLVWYLIMNNVFAIYNEETEPGYNEYQHYNWIQCSIEWTVEKIWDAVTLTCNVETKANVKVKWMRCWYENNHKVTCTWFAGQNGLNEWNNIVSIMDIINSQENQFEGQHDSYFEAFIDLNGENIIVESNKTDDTTWKVSINWSILNSDVRTYKKSLKEVWVDDNMIYFKVIDTQFWNFFQTYLTFNLEIWEDIIIDTISPVITLIWENPQTIIKWNNYIELWATAIDNIDWSINVTNNSSTVVNTLVVWDYIVEYTATDNAWNIWNITRTVKIKDIVIDKVKPVVKTKKRRSSWWKVVWMDRCPGWDKSWDNYDNDCWIDEKKLEEDRLEQEKLKKERKKLEEKEKRLKEEESKRKQLEQEKLKKIKSKIYLLRQLILSKKNLKYSLKWEKVIRLFDLNISNISNKKLIEIYFKIEKLWVAQFKYRKYKDILNYIQAKVGLEIYNRWLIK